MNSRGTKTREREVQAEANRLKYEYFTRKPTPPTVANQIQRCIIRTGRVAIGLAITAVAMYSCSSSSQKMEVPLSSLTIKDIGGLVLGYCVALGLAVWAFEVAFGEGPRLERPSESWFLEEAERRMSLSEQQLTIDPVIEAQSVRSSSTIWYRLGRGFGAWLSRTRRSRKSSSG